MAPRFSRLAAVALVLCFVYFTYAQDSKIANAQVAVSALSTQEIEEELQQCPLLLALRAEKQFHLSSTPSLLSRSFALLFPFTSPALNALMGTLYISGPPNFLLALVPTDVDPSSLNIMVAFAVGGLLGDVFFHLMPEIFLGEVPEGEVRAVLVEPNKNLLLGVAILVGFVTFVGMDKGLRIATGGEGHSHSHEKVPETANGHAINSAKASATGSSSTVSDASIRQRKQKASASPADGAVTTTAASEPKAVKLSAYLNILADFTHNITDGLAMSSSFYASPTIGATTTLAVFCHEIPHEVGDFALLIQGGMSKKVAMGLQFVTALGAVLGTVIGIVVQEYGGGAEVVGKGMGLAGTSLNWGDLLLPFTAGTFLYVGTVGVIPELLETGPNKIKELRGTAWQFLAMAAGAAIMLGVSWT